MTAAAAAAKGDAKKKGGLLKNKKVLILLVVVLAGAYFGYTKFFAAAAPAPKPTAGDTVTLDPTTLNLANGHYLKIGVAIELTAGKSTSTDFKTAQAEEMIIDEFSNRPVQSLTNKNRQALFADLIKKLKKAYDGEVFDGYLTQFVTQ